MSAATAIEQAHEAPLLFTGAMVRAVLAGQKTMTRRVINMTRLRVRMRHDVTADWPLALLSNPGWAGIRAKAGSIYKAQMNQHGAVSARVSGEWLGVKPGEFDFVCPYAAGETHLADHGDGRKLWTITPRESRLWVRETWRLGDGNAGSENQDDVHYRADADECAGGPWRPSIFMPRWASRLTLRVTGVRVERVQEISHEDAVAEGCYRIEPCAEYPHGNTWGRAAFAVLWDSINGDRPGCPWADNPWCWCVSFERAQ